MAVPTHVVYQGREYVAIIDSYGNISEFANPLRRINGEDLCAMSVWALPGMSSHRRPRG
jgi:hypothetical protein